MRKWHCTFVGEPLNHIYQDTKSARLIAVCKRTFKEVSVSERVHSSNTIISLVHKWSVIWNERFVPRAQPKKALGTSLKVDFHAPSINYHFTTCINILQCIYTRIASTSFLWILFSFTYIVPSFCLFCRSVLVSNCQTAMTSFLEFLFLLSIRISIFFYTLGFISGLRLGFFSDLSWDNMTSCQFGS